MKNEQDKENIEKILNPHDKVVKEFLSENKTAKSFFLEYLPSHITRDMDFSTLQIYKDSFVDKKLDDYFSDLLYQVDLKNTKAFVYLLIEHKSWEDHLTAFQLLKYMVKVWELYLKQNKNSRTLPVILPLVLYHGVKKWTLDTNFITLFPEIHLDYAKDAIPDFKYYLSDISHLPDDKIKGNITLKILLTTLKYIQTPGLSHKLPDIFSLFLELEDKSKGTEYLEVLLKYLTGSVNDLKEEDIRESVTKIIIEGGDIMATIAENWMKKGIEKGMEKGVKKEKIDIAKELLKCGVSFDIISKSTGLPTEKINEIKIQL